MRATRAASEDALVEASRPRLASLLAEGVTTVEIKSGYGLEFDTEARMLRAARRLAREHPVTVSTSLLAAHALPPEFAGRADDYVATICDDWLPRFAQSSLADAVDAYCEDIAFSAAQCDRLFAAARALGLPGSSRTWVARRWRHDTVRCPAITWSTPTKPTSRRSPAPGPWR
jgi:imidazolonepropionase